MNIAAPVITSPPAVAATVAPNMDVPNAAQTVSFSALLGITAVTEGATPVAPIPALTAQPVPVTLAVSTMPNAPAIVTTSVIETPVPVAAQSVPSNPTLLLQSAPAPMPENVIVQDAQEPASLEQYPPVVEQAVAEPVPPQPIAATPASVPIAAISETPPELVAAIMQDQPNEAAMMEQDEAAPLSSDPLPDMEPSPRSTPMPAAIPVPTALTTQNAQAIVPDVSPLSSASGDDLPLETIAPAPPRGIVAAPDPTPSSTTEITPETPDDFSTTLFSQTVSNAQSRPISSSTNYVPLPNEPVVTAQPGSIGRDMGVEIARQVIAGKEEVMIRLDPAEMGKIDVRMSFDREGSLRAVMAAESPAALEMLKRDIGDLSRALNEAGIRADPQSLRFDSRGGDGGQSWGRGQQSGDGRNPHTQPHANDSEENQDKQPNYRQLRTSGRIDMVA